jgi:uncharacterized protein YndB with AHSA1/START domain
MKWLGLIALAVGALVLVAAVVGLLLPRNHHASREKIVAAPPQAVWDAITGIERFPSWRKDVKHVQSLPDQDGRKMWFEDGASGKLTFVIDRAEPPRVLVTRLADPKLPFGGKWTYELAPVTNGTRVRISEDGEIYNPLFRFMARYIFGYEGTIGSYLAALQTKFGEVNPIANR